jgi:hypothetical protein
MAQAGRLDPHQHFAAAGRLEVKFSNVERLRGRIGRGQADFAKNGGFDAHVVVS